MMTILEAWNKRREMCAEGNKLYAEGKKLRTEGNKLYDEGKKLSEDYKLYVKDCKLSIEGEKLYAKSDELFAKGKNLYAEGNLIFINAIIENLGNVEIKWEGKDAIVNGVRYKWEPKAPESCEGKVVERLKGRSTDL